MGHQLNYFLTPKDFAELEDRLRARGDVQIVRSLSRTAEPCIVSSIKDAEWDGVPLRRGYLFRPEDLSKIVNEYIPAQGYWSIDTDTSPAMEFGGCSFDGHELSRGRVYYTDGFYGPADGYVNKTEKSEAFRRWAQSIFRTVKKTLKLYEKYFYIGSDTEAWIKSSNAKPNGGASHLIAGA